MRTMNWRVWLLGASGLFIGSTTQGQGLDGTNPPPSAGPALIATPPGQAPAARAQNPPQAAAIAPVDPAAQKMEDLLIQWEERSSQDQTLDARFTRTDKEAGLPEPRVFEGLALLMRPNKACIEFRERVAGKPDPVFHERIVATGDQVFHFWAQTKQVFVYQLDADARRRTLEEGPLPFMFNMRREEAKRRFNMRFLKEIPAAEGKAARVYIEIEPRLDIDQQEFVKAWVLLNRETFQPEALRLFGPNGKDTKDFQFKTVERNNPQSPAAKPVNYDGRVMAGQFQQAGWKVIVDPGPEGAALAPNGPAVGNAPGGPPARPGALPRPAPGQPALRPGAPGAGRRN